MNGRARFPFTRIMSGSLSGHRPRAAGTALLLALAAAFLIPFVSSSQGAQKAAYAGRYQSSDSCKLPAPPSRDILLDLATKCCAKPPGTSSSCKYISTADQYVVVKDADPNKPWGFLIIPTFAVTGIEDTKHTDAAPVVDFWQHGWNEATKSFLKKQAKNTALAINSKPGRDQDQLHIHLSCVLPSVASALSAADKKIGTDPKKPFSMTLGTHGNPYEVVKLTSLTGASSPFLLIKQFPGVSGSDMADQAIAIIGSSSSGTYYMAVTYYHELPNGKTDPGQAEELLEQGNACANAGHHH